MKAQSELLQLVESAIQSGVRLIYSSAMYDGILPKGDASAWAADVRHVSSSLGRAGDAWKSALWIGTPVTAGHAEPIVGTLKSLARSIQEGTLRRFEDLVSGELFDDLLEQAEYLQSESYSLPAAVLGRSVLEEKLRRMAADAGCALQKTRPTIVDLEQALGKASVLSRVDCAQVRALAAVGNAAAHNKEFDAADVPGMLSGVRSFLSKHGP